MATDAFPWQLNHTETAIPYSGQMDNSQNVKASPSCPNSSTSNFENIGTNENNFFYNSNSLLKPHFSLSVRPIRQIHLGLEVNGKDHIQMEEYKATFRHQYGKLFSEWQKSSRQSQTLVKYSIPTKFGLLSPIYSRSKVSRYGILYENPLDSLYFSIDGNTMSNLEYTRKIQNITLGTKLIHPFRNISGFNPVYNPFAFKFHYKNDDSSLYFNFSSKSNYSLKYLHHFSHLQNIYVPNRTYRGAPSLHDSPFRLVQINAKHILGLEVDQDSKVTCVWQYQPFRQYCFRFQLNSNSDLLYSFAVKTPWNPSYSLWLNAGQNLITQNDPDFGFGIQIEDD